MSDQTIVQTVPADIEAGSFVLDMGTIEGDIRDLESAVVAARRTAEQMHADAGQIAEMDYALVKNYEQGLSAAIKDAEERRKRLKRDYSAPLNEAEAKFKAVMEPVIGLHEKYREARMAADDRAKYEKREALRAYYEDVAPFIALPQEGQSEALVPFSKIMDAKWLNKSMSMRKCEEAIEEKVAHIADMEKMLDSMQLAHAAEAKAAFFATLNIDDAIRRDQNLTDSENRMRAMEEARAEQLRKFNETELTAEEAAGTRVEAPQAASKPVSDGGKGIYRIEFEAAEIALDAYEKAELINVMKRFGIHGTVRRVG